MKIRQLLLSTTLLLGSTTFLCAKGYKSAKVYMFGFAASFNDSTVYFTNIQPLDVYLMNDRTNFLVNRGDYSYQLKSFLQNEKLEEQPTCITIYSETEKKAIKEYQKLKTRYDKSKNKFYIKEIPNSQFLFKTISPTEETTLVTNSGEAVVTDKIKKGKKKEK